MMDLKLSQCPPLQQDPRGRLSHRNIFPLMTIPYTTTPWEISSLTVQVSGKLVGVAKVPGSYVKTGGGREPAG